MSIFHPETQENIYHNPKQESLHEHFKGCKYYYIWKYYWFCHFFGGMIKQ